MQLREVLKVFLPQFVLDIFNKIQQVRLCILTENETIATENWRRNQCSFSTDTQKDPCKTQCNTLIRCKRGRCEDHRRKFELRDIYGPPFKFWNLENIRGGLWRRSRGFTIEIQQRNLHELYWSWSYQTTSMETCLTWNACMSMHTLHRPRTEWALVWIDPGDGSMCIQLNSTRNS